MSSWFGLVTAKNHRRPGSGTSASARPAILVPRFRVGQGVRGAAEVSRSALGEPRVTGGFTDVVRFGRGGLSAGGRKSAVKERR